MAGRPPASQSRAGLLKSLRTLAHEAEAGAHVGLQFAGDHDRWPPQLEIAVAGRAACASPPDILAAGAVCRMICPPDLIARIAPALKDAVIAGWVSDLHLDPAFSDTTALFSEMTGL